MSQKEVERGNIRISNDWKLRKFDKRHEYKCQVAWQTSSKVNSEIQRQRQNIKSNKRKIAHHIKGILRNITSRFLFRNFRGQKQQANIFRVLKEQKKTCQARILYLAKLFFPSNRELKNSQIDKNWDLPWKKISKESCRLKWKDTTQ